MPRLTYLCGLALLLLAGAFLLADWLTWQPGVTEANVRRLRPGMPLAEVEAILGGKPDDVYGPGHDFPRQIRAWHGRAGRAWVTVRYGAVDQAGWDPE